MVRLFLLGSHHNSDKLGLPRLLWRRAAASLDSAGKLGHRHSLHLGPAKVRRHVRPVVAVKLASHHRQEASARTVG
jgi:hypothetical protein